MFNWITFIVMKNLPVSSFVQFPFTCEIARLKPVSAQTLQSHLPSLLSVVKEAIKNVLLPSKFTIVFHCWTEGTHHNVAMAVAYLKVTNGKGVPTQAMLSIKHLIVEGIKGMCAGDHLDDIVEKSLNHGVKHFATSSALSATTVHLIRAWLAAFSMYHWFYVQAISLTLLFENGFHNKNCWHQLFKRCINNHDVMMTVDATALPLQLIGVAIRCSVPDGNSQPFSVKSYFIPIHTNTYNYSINFLPNHEYQLYHVTKTIDVIDPQHVQPQTSEPTNVLIYHGTHSENPSYTTGSPTEMPIPKEEAHTFPISMIQAISPSSSITKMALLNPTLQPQFNTYSRHKPAFL